MSEKNIEKEHQLAFEEYMRNTLEAEEYDIFLELYAIASTEIDIDVDKEWKSTKSKVDSVLKNRIT